MSDLRNMKTLCGLLHDERRNPRLSLWDGHDIDALIETAERVYHNMKDACAERS